MWLELREPGLDTIVPWDSLNLYSDPLPLWKSPFNLVFVVYFPNLSFDLTIIVACFNGNVTGTFEVSWHDANTDLRGYGLEQLYSLLRDKLQGIGLRGAWFNCLYLTPPYLSAWSWKVRTGWVDTRITADRMFLVLHSANWLAEWQIGCSLVGSRLDLCIALIFLLLGCMLLLFLIWATKKAEEAESSLDLSLHVRWVESWCDWLPGRIARI